MERTKVEELKVSRQVGGEKGYWDALDDRILCFYSFSPPNFAVYRTTTGVRIHFADDPQRERLQCARIAPLAPLRGQITALIDGWREGYSDESDPDAGPPERRGFAKLLLPFDGPHAKRSKWRRAQALRYDKRVADALVLGLQRPVAAAAVMGEIKDDIIAQRKSIARTTYFAVSAVYGAIVLLLLSVLSAGWFNEEVRLFPTGTVHVWTGAAGGTFGAFFSIAMAVGGRTVLLDLQKADNRRDAVLRMTVGTIGGGVAVLFVLLGLLDILSLGDRQLSLASPGPQTPFAAFVVGFIAGFSERLIPDLLSKSSTVAESDSKPKDDEAKAAGALPAEPPADEGDGTEDGTEADPEAEVNPAEPPPGDQGPAAGPPEGEGGEPAPDR